LIHAKLPCFGDVGDVHPFRDVVRGIGSGHDAVLPELLYCPAQRCHSVFDGPGRELDRQPAGDELLDMLGLQALGPQTAMAHFVQLIGDQI
jgi:hypothetical protein